jgi:hypothetical protein
MTTEATKTKEVDGDEAVLAMRLSKIVRKVAG